MVLSHRPLPVLAIARILAIGTVLAGALAACQPPHPAAKDPAAADAAAFEAKGYTHAPVITGLKTGEAGFVVISGTAPADSRMRFAFVDPLKSGTQAVGVTTDAQGRFQAEVPIGAGGGLYDVTVDDGSRLRQMEGRLFVPPGRPDHAVLMRPGAPSLPLFAGGGALASMDYDGNGAFALSGHVRPMAMVDVALDGQVLAQARADASGLYTLLIQINKLPPDEVLNIAVTSSGVTAKQDATMAVAIAGPGNHVTPAGSGWRIGWTVPGGGTQSTVVF